jgi:hypothetical protein
MGFSNNLLSRTGIVALMAGVVMALSPMKAEAATIYATSAIEIGDASALRGTANDRDNLNNAFGAADGAFFELGYEGVFEFQFGTPTGQAFFGPGSIVEITFGNRNSFPEAVKIEVGLKGNAASFITAAPNPVVNNGPAGSSAFTFAGVFDTVRLTDVTRATFPKGAGSDDRTGGFDVDAIGVSPVPLPAAGFLLLGGLGGLVALRRRRKAA